MQMISLKLCNSFVQQYDTTLSLVSKDVRDLENGLTSDLEGVAKWVSDNNSGSIDPDVTAE